MGRLAGFAVACAAVAAVVRCPLAADIHEAVRQNSPEALQAALDAGEDINKIGTGGQTPLMHGVLNGNAKAVAFLLGKGADTTIGEKDGYTPMHGAGFQGRAEIAKLLIEHRLDPSNMHSDGYTPLHRACWGGEQRHTDMVQVLIDAGVSPEEASRDGKLPIDMVRENKMTKKVLKRALKALKSNCSIVNNLIF